jgi:hypothetical protein
MFLQSCSEMLVSLLFLQNHRRRFSLYHCQRSTDKENAFVYDQLTGGIERRATVRRVLVCASFPATNLTCFPYFQFLKATARPTRRNKYGEPQPLLKYSSTNCSSMVDPLTFLVLLILQCSLSVQVLASFQGHEHLHIPHTFDDPTTILERSHIEGRQTDERPLLRISK